MQTINSKELFELMKQKTLNVIDIREPLEHKYGHVPGCINIPMTNILLQPNNYLKKNETYYIICQSGNRSTTVSNFLDSKGYKVINVMGGHNDWPGKLVK